MKWIFCKKNGSCQIPKTQQGNLLGSFGVMQCHFEPFWWFWAILGHFGAVLGHYGAPVGTWMAPGWSNMTYNHVIYPWKVVIWGLSGQHLVRSSFYPSGAEWKTALKISKNYFSLGPNGRILKIFLVVQFLGYYLKIFLDCSNNLFLLDQVKRRCELIFSGRC